MYWSTLREAWIDAPDHAYRVPMTTQERDPETSTPPSHDGTPGAAPEHHAEPAADGVIDLVIEAKPRPLDGDLVVRRALPHMHRRLVGPFIFFDHFGPTEMKPGDGLDVRPHPHIGLATLTYLFDGAIMHRDSLGNSLAIRPGAVNWMTSGKGIVHSERTPPEERASGQHMHGTQLWVALSLASEECAPSFKHYGADEIPSATLPGVDLRVVVGEAYGVRSPVATDTRTLYVDAVLQAGAKLEVPDDYEERGAYVVQGAIECGGRRFEVGTLVVFAEEALAEIKGASDVDVSRVMLLGGAPIDGKRLIEWNFVASSHELLEKAKEDWRAGRFPKVPGDSQEFIPLPEVSKPHA